MSKLIPRLKSVGLNLIRYKQATISVTWQSSSRSTVGWSPEQQYDTGIQTFTMNNEHGNSLVKRSSWHRDRHRAVTVPSPCRTIMDTWCSGTAWGRPWCSCSTLRPRPHSSPQDCAPSPDVFNSHILLSLGQVHFWHNFIELAGLLLTCLRWVSLPCWWFCSTAICNMKVRT